MAQEQQGHAGSKTYETIVEVGRRSIEAGEVVPQFNYAPI